MIIKNGQTSNLVRLSLKNSTTGLPLTGLTFSSTGLIIGTIADNEQTSIFYTTAASTIETITTLGTYAAPTTFAGPPPTKCRFKEVDSGNHPGLYELQLADARFAVTNARSLIITLSGATNLLATDFLIQLSGAGFDPLFNAAPGAAGGVFIAGSNATTTIAGQLNITDGVSITTATTANRNGLSITGNGSGRGVNIVGGLGGGGGARIASGAGSSGIPGSALLIDASSGSSDAIYLNALTNALNSGSGGFNIGALSADSITVAGQVNITDGVAITTTTTANRAGLAITGNGTGHGMTVTAGSSGGGNGLFITAGGAGDAFQCFTVGTGRAMYLNASAAGKSFVASGGFTAIAASVWDELTTSHITPSTFGVAMTSGGGLTPLQVRDAMKLAPSAGAPAVGSVDTLIAAAEQSSAFATDFAAAFGTATAGADTLASALDAQGYTAARAAYLDIAAGAQQHSTFASDFATAFATATTGAGTLASAMDAQGYTAARAVNLDNISGGQGVDQAGVQAAMTAQGYTPTRAPKLDYLDVPVSGLSGGLTDLNEEPVPSGRTCTLVRDSLIGDHAVTLKIGTDPTFCMDFVNDIATNDYISIVDTPIMVSGPTNGITFGQTGRDHSKAKVRIAGITAGTYQVSVRVTYNDGSTRTGTMTIEVVA